MEEKTRELLKKLDETDDLIEKRDIIMRLADIGTVTAIPKLMQLAKHRDAGLRYFAKKAAGRIRNREEGKITPEELGIIVGKKLRLDTFQKYLLDPDYRHRVVAGLAVIKTKDKRTLPFLLEKLKIEEHDFVKATLVKAIGAVGGPKVIPVLVPFLSDPDNRVRANTIEGLVMTGGNILEYILPLLTDHDNRVRANAAVALSKMNPEEAITTLKRMIKTGEEWMKDSAIFALKQLKTIEAQKELEELGLLEEGETILDTEYLKSEEDSEIEKNLNKMIEDIDKGPTKVFKKKKPSKTLVIEKPQGGSKIWKIAIIIIIVVLIAAGAYFYIPVYLKSRTYSSALKLYFAKKYKEAIEKFSLTKGFKDTDKYLKKARLALAIFELTEALRKDEKHRVKEIINNIFTSFTKEDLQAQLMDVVKQLLYVKKNYLASEVLLQNLLEKGFIKENDENLIITKLNLSEELLARNQFDEAENRLLFIRKHYSSLPLDLSMTFKKFYIKLGTKMLSLGKYEKARKLLIDYLDLGVSKELIYPKLKNCYIGMAIAAQEKRNFKKAFSLFEKARQIDSSLTPEYCGLTASNFYLGKYYEKLGGISRAIYFYKKALEYGERKTEALQRLVEIYTDLADKAVAKNEFKKAEKYLLTIPEMKTSIKVIARLEKIYKTLADKAKSENNLDLAKKYYDKILKLNPQSHLAKAGKYTLQLINIKELIAKQEYEKAKKQLNKILALAPENKEAQEVMVKLKLAIAGDYYLQGEYKKAITILKKYYESYPDNQKVKDLLIKSYIELGKDLMIEGKFLLARVYFEAVLKINKDNFEAEEGALSTYVKEGRLFEEKGELAKAADVYKTAVKKFKDRSLPRLLLKKVMQQMAAKEREEEEREARKLRELERAREDAKKLEELKKRLKLEEQLKKEKMFGKIYFEYTDPKGDDYGPGTYTYPLNTYIRPGAFDIIKFTVKDGGENVVFEVEISAEIEKYVEKSEESARYERTGAECIEFVVGENGWVYQMFDIYIDKDGKPGSGHIATLPGRSVRFSDNSAWEVAILVSPEDPFTLEKDLRAKTEISYVFDIIDDVIVARNPVAKGRTFIVKVPKSQIGTPQAYWGYQVLMMGYQKRDLAHTLRIIPVHSFASNCGFGGGTDYMCDPNILDILTGQFESQKELLRNYNKVPNPDVTDYTKINCVYIKK